MSQVRFKELFDLKGKTAVVTGGAGILGRQFCRGLAEFGADVAVIDLNESAAKELAGELCRDYHVRSEGVACDLTSPDSVDAMVKKVTRTFGGIHILHSNATKSVDQDAYLDRYEDYSLESWQQMLSVDLNGMFLVTQGVGKQMILQGTGGSMIQTASIYGIMSPDQRIYEGSFYNNRPISSPAVYTAAKGGVVALTRYLATYWAPKGIRVNSITPGGVESGQNEEFKKRYSNRIPMGRMARSHEMVSAVIYLASDASSYVTGQNIIIDGGLNAW
ncbi:MAG: SDR family oxidoreductase [Candidatus Omnitrophota bacterium]|jgi:NAD(P)-dependent dehydrogenase (short-subunit alcohol dehydrogenase family)